MEQQHPGNLPPPTPVLSDEAWAERRLAQAEDSLTLAKIALREAVGLVEAARAKLATLRGRDG